MKVLPLLVFAAAAGVGSGVMFFKHTSQLGYENAVLTLRVHKLERAIAGLREAQLRETKAPLSVVTGDGGRVRLTPPRSRR